LPDNAKRNQLKRLISFLKSLKENAELMFEFSRDPKLFPVVPSDFGIPFNRKKRIILDKFSKDNYFPIEGGD